MGRQSMDSAAEAIAVGCLMVVGGLLFIFSGTIFGVSGFINCIPLPIIGLLLVVAGVFIAIGGIQERRKQSSSHYQVMPPPVEKKRSPVITDFPVSDLGQQQESFPTPMRKVPINNWALVSFLLSLFSLCGGILTGIPAIVLGFIALRKIGNSGGQTRGKELAWAGIVVGFILATISTCLVIAALLSDISAQ